MTLWNNCKRQLGSRKVVQQCESFWGTEIRMDESQFLCSTDRFIPVFVILGA